MRKKTIAKNLTRALLNDGPLVKALYEYELEEHLEEYLQSKKDDQDKYFFAITEHSNDVAMLLVDEDDTVYINMEAREQLKKIWGEAYVFNIKKLIPGMASQLDEGFLYAAGVKEVEHL